MVGAEVSGAATAGNFVRGDATLTADFAAVNVDVVFNNIRDLTTSAPRADITWNDIPITGGAFRTDTIQGSFYGQNHEEVGGIFGRSNLQGAFGAKR